MGSCNLLLAAVLLIALSCNSFTSASSLKLAPGSKCVYLKNALFDEYLYSASSQFKAESHTNRIFTWRRKSDGDAKNWEKSQGKESKYQGVWLLEPKPSACSHVCFAIKSAFNPKNPEPLFAVSETDKTFNDPKRRPVYTFSAKTSFPAAMGEDIWEIVYVPGFFDRIRLRTVNEKGNLEYLYSADDIRAFDGNRRNVYTWSSTTEGNIDTWNGAGDWIMTDASCPDFKL